MKLTREFFRKNHACYTDAHIAKIVPLDGLTALEVCDLPIPPADVVWALTRPEACSERVQRLFAVRCARRALARVPNPDPRSVAACDVAEHFANGQATSAELEAAWAAAEAAWAVVASQWAAVEAAEREAQVRDFRELLGSE